MSGDVHRASVQLHRTQSYNYTKEYSIIPYHGHLGCCQYFILTNRTTMKGFVHASYNFFGQCILGDRSLKVGLWAKGKCIRIMLGIGKFSSTGVAGGGEIS